MTAAENPLDVLREALVPGYPLKDVPAALSAVEQLVEAARAADAVLYEHMPEWYGDREWPELDVLREALARFPVPAQDTDQ